MRNVNLVGPSAYMSGFVNFRYGIIFNLSFQLKDPHLYH